MSQLLSRLDRNNITWGKVGQWSQTGLNSLENIANRLDVAEAMSQRDLLNSVPTPWARLLLFERALHTANHPAHAEITSQWRGLLGLLALAEPLGLKKKLSLKTVKLEPQQSEILKSFKDLAPDTDARRWQNSHLIVYDGKVIGATSPYTLVFTGVAHDCPASFPFRNQLGRLIDPTRYYEDCQDGYFLNLLRTWLDKFVSDFGTNPQASELVAWLGQPPTTPGAAVVARYGQVRQRLQEWQNELSRYPALVLTKPTPPALNVPHYKVIPALGREDLPAIGDLFLRGSQEKVIVHYHQADGAELYDAHDQEVREGWLKICPGHYHDAAQPLPASFDFLPDDITVLKPSQFFEPALIQVDLPEALGAAQGLTLGQNTYLYPFTEQILRWFTIADLIRHTEFTAESGSIKVVLTLPVTKGVVRVTKYYSHETIWESVGQGEGNSERQARTAELAVWPDFVATHWKRYFYFKSKPALAQGVKLLDFEPSAVGPATLPKREHEQGRFTWFEARQPLTAFRGTVEGQSGLLLWQPSTVIPPTNTLNKWRVAVDFGSTHTRVFYLDVQKDGNSNGGSYHKAQGASITPVSFRARAQALTYAGIGTLKPYFPALATDAATANPKREVVDEVTTLLMMPNAKPAASYQDWLPHEGHVYNHWIYGGDYLKNNDRTYPHLRTNLKWNRNSVNSELRIFLRSLLLMVEVEAAAQGAEVVEILHTYPSVLPVDLRDMHNQEWNGLQTYLNSHNLSQLVVHDATSELTETVATCRYLADRTRGGETASPTNHTISFDVGGSTTDIAVWANNKLHAQESIKLAAGLVGRYLQQSSQEVQELLNEIEKIIKASYGLPDFSINRFAPQNAPRGTQQSYALMFNDVLTYLKHTGKLDQFTKQLSNNAKANGLMARLRFLFSGFAYYAGLLTRKCDLAGAQTYYLWFCGKGGTLLKWLPNHDLLINKMFLSGLTGPDNILRGTAPNVQTKLSPAPKEEVGRGLLAGSLLSDSRTDETTQSADLITPTPPSVTIGETGYHNLVWNSQLTGDVINALARNSVRVPRVAQMRELTHFLNSLHGLVPNSFNLLNLANFDESLFVDELQERLFGAQEGSVWADIQRGQELIEPFFVTELKVLLEVATNQSGLFID